MVDKEKRELGKWWMWILLLLVVSGIVFTGMKYLGLVGGTIIEREVFEHSYQRTSALASRESAYVAQLASIEYQIQTETDEDTLKQLKAQRAMLNVQIDQVRREK